MPLAPGTRLGPYEIGGAIGAGGMGEVYRARDTRLDREVALKVLPRHVSGDQERRERFEREARAASRLSHPHICTIYDVGEQDGQPYLAMELVEGRTLADLIPAKGFSLDQLLKVAIPLVDAVSAAHERGITHRDLKPANVMVTTDGRVKVLDFGLAKLREDLASSESTTVALQPHPLTGEGRIVGTVFYMSPEQVEGKAVDHRSDIFSLGVVLYEMATGHRPFTGDSTAATMSSILRDTPRLVTEINPSLPRDLAKIVRRVLTKDAEHRYQSAKDFRNELEELKRELDSGELAAAAASAAASRRSDRVVWIWAGAGAIVVGAAWLAISWLGPSHSAPPPLQVTFTKITSAPGVETSPSLSPDGKWIVYASAGHIQLQSVGGQASSPINLTKDEPAADSQPAFSPDGELIAFRSGRGGGGIWLMGRTGESVRRLTNRGFYPAWTPDGRYVVFSTEGTLDPESRQGPSEGWKAEVATDKETRISIGDFMQPAVSPNGLRIAYWGMPVTNEASPRFSGNNRDIWTIPLDGGGPVPVTVDSATDWSPAWSADGRFLYFASDRGGSMNLWRIAIDEGSGRVLGPAEAVTAPSPWLGLITRSGDGRRFAYASYEYIRNVARVPFDPVRGAVVGDPEPITVGTLACIFPQVSPDGLSVVLQSYYRQVDLYVLRPGGSGPWTSTQLTNDAAKDRMPRWSPDGGEIAFYSNRGGVYSLWTIKPDGSGLRQRVSMGKALTIPVWSPDGSRLIAGQAEAHRNFVFALRDDVVSEPIETLLPFPDPDVEFWAWSWSPDSRKIAGWAAQTGSIWVYSFDTKSYTQIVDGTYPIWLSDSRRLIYPSRGRLFLVDTVTKQSREVLGPLAGEALSGPNLARDDRHLYYVHGTTSADIGLMTIK